MIYNDIPTWHQIDSRVIHKVQALNPSQMLECGTWKGHSAAIWLQNTNTHLTVVDTFLGAVEFLYDTNDYKRNLHRDTYGYPQVHTIFAENMIRLGIWDRITVIPNTSKIAARYLRNIGMQFDCVYLDGSHEYEDIRDDIRDYKPLVKSGGFLFGDDYAPEWNGVQRAVDEVGLSELIGRYWFIYC
jgi:hypothetical protein